MMRRIAAPVTIITARRHAVLLSITTRTSPGGRWTHEHAIEGPAQGEEGPYPDDPCHALVTRQRREHPPHDHRSGEHELEETVAGYDALDDTRTTASPEMHDLFDAVRER